MTHCTRYIIRSHLLCQSDNMHWVMQIVIYAFLLTGRCGSLIVHAQSLVSSPPYSLVVTGVPPGTAGEVATGTSLPQPIWSPEPQRRGQGQEVSRLPQRFHWANCLKYSNCTRKVRTYSEVCMAHHPHPVSLCSQYEKQQEAEWGLGH